MINDFNQMDNDEMEEDASIGSEDSQEPYFHVHTGKIYPAREAWGILAAEGHPRYESKLSGTSSRRSSHQNDESESSQHDNVDSVFRDSEPLIPDSPTEEESETDIHQTSSFGGPSQSSIDRALHPESPNYISPNKDIRNSYKKSTSLGYDGAMACPDLDDEDGETDPVVLRAKAMALAAQNGQKLTAEQMQLIAQPDVQQQKLIEEAKRVQKAKEMDRHQHQLLAPPNLQQIGADFKKFIQTEKEKPPMQWGADLGKFIENQGLKMSHGNAGAEGGMGIDEDDDVGSQEGRNDKDDSGSPPMPSPKTKKKMEGFGTDPLAPRLSPGGTPVESTEGTPLRASVKGMFSSVNMPPLPMLNESITNMLPGAGAMSKEEATHEPVRISGVLWKRRSGFGKHSTIKAWEKRRVELRGSKLMYYQSAEEEEEGRFAVASAPSATAPAVSSTPDNGSELNTPRNQPNEAEVNLEVSPPNKSDPDSLASSKKLSIFGQAAQAAEQRIQNARDELTRLASVTGLQAASADAPRGILDVLKEKASVSASTGHSGAPTPFCLSIKVKSETKWKFCFDSHGFLMEWLSALTDVTVKASVEAARQEGNSSWEMEKYCLRVGGAEEGHEESNAKSIGDGKIIAPNTAGLSDRETRWMIVGMNLYVAWGLANIALVIGRCSSTSIDQYWQLVVFTNFGMWMLCTRPKVSSLLRSNDGAAPSVKPKESKAIVTKRPSYQPIAGNTTVQVAKVEDPNMNKNGDQLPSWIPVSSCEMDVRSHGYLTTKKKIPSPGELYDCVAVDCFVSNSRFSDIAPRVRLPKVDGDDSANKMWKSPDIFVVSIAMPTEAPRFGQSTDDGPGLTIVGYFKMKDETRKILQRITATGYDPSTDTSDSDVDVQKRIVNGVRLWEQYCQQAPSDPTFQARFKLIPSVNMEELGCPSYITKYNGKPVLIKRNQVTGFFNDYPSLNVMEFDISLHPFPYLFKQGMAYIKDYFDKAVGTFGFVIEGRNDDELPEVVIGAMKLCYPSPKFIVNGEEFFSGTCPKSTRD